MMGRVPLQAPRRQGMAGQIHISSELESAEISTNTKCVAI